MNPFLGLGLILIYFSLLIWVSSRIARGETDSQAFFVGNRSSKWYLVAFGMIGTSLSGVTFISVPGQVKAGNLHYLQIVLGYLIGYVVIANVLMPLYYRLQLVSIYTYLEQRFGFWSYKTGAAFFILSRLLGSSARFFLVLSVLHQAIFIHFHIPFWLSVGIGLLLIWLYTWKGGIKTIVVTDTLQTFCMLAAVVVSIVFLSGDLIPEGGSLFDFVASNPNSGVWNTDPVSKFFWLKQILAGAFIAITMTGLDQDMMQKNLTCKSLGEAQKNIYWFSGTLLVVNTLFLVLGLMLYAYAAQHQIELPAKRLAPPNNAIAHRRVAAGANYDTTAITGTVAALGPLTIRLVRRTEDETLFAQLLRDHHYLGYSRPVGEHLKYLILAGERPVACLAWSSAPRQLDLRDQLVGAPRAARRPPSARQLARPRRTRLPPPRRPARDSPHSRPPGHRRPSRRTAGRIARRHPHHRRG
jgi:Na+/proline symporter